MKYSWFTILYSFQRCFWYPLIKNFVSRVGSTEGLNRAFQRVLMRELTRKYNFWDSATNWMQHTKKGVSIDKDICNCPAGPLQPGQCFYGNWIKPPLWAPGWLAAPIGQVLLSSQQSYVAVLISHLETGDLGDLGGGLVNKEAGRLSLGHGVSEW